MNNPIYEELKAAFDIMKATSKIEARQELADELKTIARPSKQLTDIIKKLENGTPTNK